MTEEDFWEIPINYANTDSDRTDHISDDEEIEDYTLSEDKMIVYSEPYDDDQCDDANLNRDESIPDESTAANKNLNLSLITNTSVHTVSEIINDPKEARLNSLLDEDIQENEEEMTKESTLNTTLDISITESITLKRVSPGHSPKRMESDSDMAPSFDDHKNIDLVSSAKRIKLDSGSQLTDNIQADKNSSGNTSDNSNSLKIVNTLKTDTSPVISKAVNSANSENTSNPNDTSTTCNPSNISNTSTSTETSSSSSSEQLYMIEKIVNYRFHPKTKEKQYRIKWEGWASNTNTWEPESTVLDAAPILVKQFEKKLEEKNNKSKSRRRSTRQKVTVDSIRKKKLELFKYSNERISFGHVTNKSIPRNCEAIMQKDVLIKYLNNYGIKDIVFPN